MPEDTQQLQTRHAPATFAPPLPETLRIRVPPAFQAYLVRWHKWAVAIGLPAAAVAPIAFYGFSVSRLSGSISEYMWITAELMAFLGWRSVSQRPWYYEFGPLDAKLIHLEQPRWAWVHLPWRENAYVTVERSTWRDLPALIITRRSRYFWQRTKLMLVYSPADEQQIAQIVPFMQRHGTLVSEGAWYQRA